MALCLGYAPDAKAQVTLRYDEHHQPLAVDALVLSTQHNPDISQKQLQEAVMEEIIKKSFHLSYYTKTHYITSIQQVNLSLVDLSVMQV